MVIIFYEANENKIYISSTNRKMVALDADDPNLMDHVPNDSILYVQTGDYITKSQFNDWLNGNMPDLDDDPEPEVEDTSDAPFQQTNKSGKKRYFVHPVHNGTIILSDIKTKDFPDGLMMNGKYDFIPIDSIGMDVLEESKHFKIALSKGKIKISPESYVKQNIHKKTTKISPSEAALDKILIPAYMKAEEAADKGGIHQDDIAETIYVDD